MQARPELLTSLLFRSDRRGAAKVFFTMPAKLLLPTLGRGMTSILASQREERERMRVLLRAARLNQPRFRTITNAHGDRDVGNWVDGQLNGYGERTHANGDKYVGQFASGKAEGSGTCTYASNGDIYDGGFAGGVRSGDGTMTWAAGHTYDGAWADDQPHGHGTMVWAADGGAGAVGKRYVGEFRRGLRHGSGVQTWADGRVFEGQWVDGERHGAGRMRWSHPPIGASDDDDATAAAGAEEFVGEWKRDHQEGRGSWRTVDGRGFDGEWRGGVAHGPGRMRLGNGESFDGQFVSGVRHGVGVHSYADGGRVTGEWRAGRLDGLAARVWPREEEAQVKLNADGQVTLEWANTPALLLEGVWHGGRRLLGGFSKRQDAAAIPREVGFGAQWERHNGAGAAPPPAGKAPPAPLRSPRARWDDEQQQPPPVQLRILPSPPGSREAARVKCVQARPWPAGVPEAGVDGAEVVSQRVLEHLETLPPPTAAADDGAAAVPPPTLLPASAARRPSGAAPLGAPRLAPRRHLPSALGSPRVGVRVKPSSEPAAAAESQLPAAATAAVDDAPSPLVRIEDGPGFYLRVVIDLELMQSLAEQ